MKMLLLALLLFTSSAFASSDEYLFGSLTEHFFIDKQVSERFDNKVGDEGRLIFNPTLAYRRVIQPDDMYGSYGGFIGQNSVGELMVGGLTSYGKQFGKVTLGLVAGMYLQDDKKFRDRQVEPFKLFEVDRVGFVPIAGVELGFKQKIDDGAYITIVNIISPILTSTSLGIGWEI